MFKFKQFTIHQDRTAMKVGTDGVLLGAWAPIAPTARRILDIGTGTGLIALMIAQRMSNCELNITAIDIDEASIKQATENIKNSPFIKHIKTIHASLQDFRPEETFDAIVCNPPYFVASMKCPDAGRTQARHTDSLSFDELLLHSDRLLNNDGTLSVILPVNEGKQFIDIAPKYGFTLTQLVHVRPTPTSEPKRLLMHFIKQSQNNYELCIMNYELIIELSRHNYTPEYIALTKDFYLKM